MSHQQPSVPSSAATTSHLLIDPTDAAFVLLDHQSGLLQTIKDIGIGELRANTTMLARLAALLDIPVITSASVPDGPNGPLMPEIHEAAPHARFVTRKGEINAWDNEDFVNTVRETGRRTLIMAGVWTSVCVALPALAAIAAGYRVFVVHDASGDPSEFASRITMARLVQAGASPVSASAVLCEFQRHWNRPNNQAFAELYVQIAPNYGAVVESFRRAQAAAHKAHLVTA